MELLTKLEELVLIACIGLFGLASFSAEQRRREIEVRRALPAPTRFKRSRRSEGAIFSLIP